MKESKGFRPPKLRTVILLLSLLSFAGCIAAVNGGRQAQQQVQQNTAPTPVPQPPQAPQGPTTNINIENLSEEAIQQLRDAGVLPGGEVVAANKYDQAYLTSLSQGLTLAEAEWERYKVCRKQTIYADALKQSQESNGRVSLEDVLLEKLAMILAWGESAASGQRWLSHEANKADAFRDPGSDALIIMEILDGMTKPGFGISPCQQDPNALWDQVKEVVDAGQSLARETVPVRLIDPQGEDLTNAP